MERFGIDWMNVLETRRVERGNETTMIQTARPRFMAEINVVPLVDVVLVLLVIFMVTAPMLYRGLDINLPQSATNTIKPEQRVVCHGRARSPDLCGQGGC